MSISTYVHFTRLNTRVVVTNQVDGVEIDSWLIYEIDLQTPGNTLVDVKNEPDQPHAHCQANRMIEMANALADSIHLEPYEKI